MGTARSLEDILNQLRTEPQQPISEHNARSLQNLSDQAVLLHYDSIRQQVAAEMASRHEYRFVGEAAKQRAQLLQSELVRRGLSFDRIIWP